MGQRTLVLANAGLLDGALRPSRPLPPSHDCVGSPCTMVGDCDWVAAWRAADPVRRGARS